MKTIVQENKDNSSFKLICTIIWPKKFQLLTVIPYYVPEISMITYLT